MKRRVLVVCLGLALGSLADSGELAGRADAVVRQVERADRATSTVRVTYAERLAGGRLYFELNNGATYRATACAAEDSRSCWWDARSRGNGKGRSFVDLRGQLLHLPTGPGGVR